MVRDFFHTVGRGRAGRMCALVVAMFFSALLETLGISMVVTACSLLVDEQRMAQNPLILRLCQWLGLTVGSQLITAMLFMLMGIYLFKFVYLLTVSYAQARFVRTFRHETSSRLFRHMLHGPYEAFTKTSAAAVYSLLGAETDRAAAYLSNALHMAAESLVMVCIVILLLVVDPIMTLFVLGGIGLSLLLTHLICHRPAYRAGKIRQQANAKRLKWLNQGVHGIKDVKAAQREAFFCDRYEQEDDCLARMEVFNQVLTRAPALFIESTLVICMLLYVLYLLRSGQDVVAFLPSLSALVLVALRMLPCCNRINGALNQMSYARASFETVSQALRQMQAQQASLPSSGGEQTALAESLTAQDVTFRYEGRPEPVLHHVSIRIPVGASVGIVGPSGAGKTTLVDILLGLLKPQEGAVLADGVNIERCYASYLRQVAYIPQNVFLLDDTIRSNVALGVPPEQVDDAAVWRALEGASLDQFVHGLPEGLDTQVGESGIRLSGGERQRLGIARALYRGGRLMIFDEATSALDPDTEAAIIRSIHALRGEKTLLIISHRHSAVQDCDILYRVEGAHVRCQTPPDPSGGDSAGAPPPG